MTLLAELNALDPLLSELAVTRTVKVISDDKLCRRLAKGASADAKPRIKPVAGIDGSCGVEPGAILMELAEVSAPPLIPPGLRGLSLRWAWLRYCWTFAPGAENDNLTLSEAAWSLAQHHKQVSADQLGVGFALDMTRRALEAGGAKTKVYDADLVIDGVGAPSIWGFTHGAGLRPDYFIEVTDPSLGGGTKVYVLECKGTHSGAHLGQLRKGLRQVMAVVGEDGTPFAGIVCSTGFTKTRTTLRIVDPDDEPEGGFPTPAADREARAEIRRSKDGVRIGKPAAFRRELAQLDSAALLSFAGRYADAHELLPARLRDRERDGDDVAPVRNEEPIPWHALDRPATGASFSLPLADGRRLRVVAAVDDEVLAAARRDSPKDLMDAQGRFAERRAERPRGRAERAAKPDESPPRFLLEPDEAGRLQIVGRNGHSLTLAID